MITDEEIADAYRDLTVHKVLQFLFHDGNVKAEVAHDVAYRQRDLIYLTTELYPHFLKVETWPLSHEEFRSAVRDFCQEVHAGTILKAVEDLA